MSKLSPCPRCRRLLRQKDGTCPFCFATRTVALAAILPLTVACQRGAATNDAGGAASSTPQTTTSAVASASGAPAATDTVAPLAPLVASATPSALASARQAAIGRDRGSADPALLAALSADAGSLGNLFGDGGLAALGTVNPGVAAYGAPPQPGLTGLPGIGAYGGPPSPGLDALAPGNVATSMSGTHNAFDDRVVASRRIPMRGCYATGLKTNPSMAGKVKATVVVAPAGTATVTATPEGSVSAEVSQCIAQTLRTALYDPSAHTFQVDVTLTKP